jgi:hypothetical protein
MEQTNNMPGRRLLYLVIFLVLVGSVYSCISAVRVAHNSGVIRIKSSSTNAALIITQPNHEAVIIGHGSASVRLQPGTYQLSAAASNKHDSTVVRVSRGSSASIKLDPKPILSVYAVNFEGTDSLINSGLTTTQLGLLKQDFFSYKPSVQTVTINTASVTPGPHDPHGADPSFSINFKLTIDKKPYNAIAEYTNLSTIGLRLYDSKNNSLIYDSGTTSE